MVTRAEAEGRVRRAQASPRCPTNVFSDLEPFTETQPVGHYLSRSG